MAIPGLGRSKLPQCRPPRASISIRIVGEAALIAANHLVVEWVFYAVFAGILAAGPVSRRYLAAKPVIDRAAALILGALGLRLALD